MYFSGKPSRVKLRSYDFLPSDSSLSGVFGSRGCPVESPQANRQNRIFTNCKETEHRDRLPLVCLYAKAQRVTHASSPSSPCPPVLSLARSLLYTAPETVDLSRMQDRNIGDLPMILDYDGYRIFYNFTLTTLGKPVYYEP